MSENYKKTTKKSQNKGGSEKSEVALREEKVLEFWNKNNIFEKSVERPAGKETPEEYTFYDGPPFATGLPHYGHLLQSFVKDAVPRYKTMRGFRVKRQWGWDCHGLPIENIVERELGISGREDIKKIGVKKFNDICREKIFTYAKEWEKIIPRIGRWADMENAYKTMDTDYMESEWWAFKQLYDNGLIYEDYRSMHICPRCETTLSQSEVTEGYQTVKDLAVTVKFPLKDEPNTFVLAWTTTPWTLPGNVALAVGEDIKYVKVEEKDEEGDNTERFILAKDALESVFGDSGYSIISEMSGSELIGKEYTPPFDSYINDETLKNRENAWKIYSADFIDTDTGTGIAHEAPAFGAEDMELAQKKDLPLIQHVGMNGIIKSEVKELSGLNVKPKDDRQATDVEVIKYLAHKGLLFAKEKYEHSYPHCWRCDTPLLNYATTSWFVSVSKIKNNLLDYAKDINWSPAHIKEGRWGNWLEGARDWSISRSRFWANTMPVWRCNKCDEEKVFGSIAELKDASGVEVNDLHKDVVDEIIFSCEKCDGEMRRIPDVLDTWFDSGSVPYATLHYPFENESEFKKRLPVDFIAEAQDQTRAWFYYQHVLSGGLFKSNAFKNCIVTGMVLAEDGKKMSKKLQNYPDPMYMVDKYGADAMRMYILGSPVVRTEALNFSEKEVGEISRKLFGRLVNVYEFYDLYKDDINHTDSSSSENVLDVWIVSLFNKLHKEVTESMDSYHIDKAIRPIVDFIDDLSTWYIRRSRDRFKGKDKEDKKHALETTRFVLRKYAKILAPFAPFHADWLWERVRRENDTDSVHLTHWCGVKDIEEVILNNMNVVREIVSLALEARDKAGIKVRQPLQSLKIKTEAGITLEKDILEIIADEVNVKEVTLDESMAEEVLLDTNITPELAREGQMRDLIRAVQSLRKEKGLKPGESAELIISCGDNLIALIEDTKDELKKVASVSNINFSNHNKGKEIEIDNNYIFLSLLC